MITTKTLLWHSSEYYVIGTEQKWNLENSNIINKRWIEIEKTFCCKNPPGIAICWVLLSFSFWHTSLIRVGRHASVDIMFVMFWHSFILMILETYLQWWLGDPLDPKNISALSDTKLNINAVHLQQEGQFLLEASQSVLRHFHMLLSTKPSSVNSHKSAPSFF